MARPTRRRRSTKHRGNAAGMIEARGRTGRKPTTSEKQGGDARRGVRGTSSSTARKNRYETPPTWRGSAIRAAAAAAIVYAMATFILHRGVASNLVLLPIVLALYMPMIFYTDMYMYRRYQRRKNK